jgi:hypothetical protein
MFFDKYVIFQIYDNFGTEISVWDIDYENQCTKHIKCVNGIFLKSVHFEIELRDLQLTQFYSSHFQGIS